MSQPQSSPSSPGTSPPPGARAPRRKGRWGRRLGLAFVVLVLGVGALVGFAPQLASMPAVYNWGLGLANGALRGTLAIDGLSASWTGPIEVRGLKVSDPAGQEVLSVSRLTLATGVWGLVRSYLDFGQIEIDAPQVTLILTPDNRLTLAEAFSSRTPSTSSASGELPQPRGRIILRDGLVRVLRAAGEPYEVSQISGDVTLASLAEIAGTLSARLDQGPTLSADVATRGLVSNGAFSAQHASGTLKIASDGPIDLGRLTRVLAPDAAVDGQVTLAVDGVFNPGDVRATIDTSVAELRSAAVSGVRPLDASLRGNVQVTTEQLVAKLDLASPAGTATADLTYALTDRPPAVTVEQVLAAVLGGESLTLPNFSLRATASIDLAAVEAAVPGLLTLREGQQVTQGRLELSDLSASGGAAPAARGALELRDLSVSTDGTTIRPEPIALSFDAAVEPGQGLRVRQADLRTAFATLTAAGAVDDLSATFRADLARLQSELGQIVDLGQSNLAGQLEGHVQLAKAGDDAYRLRADAAATGIRYEQAGRPVEVRAARAQHEGRITLRGGRPGRVDAERVEVDLDGQVVAAGQGWYELQGGGYGADISISRADLGFVTGKVATLAGAKMGEVAGVLSGAAKVHKPAGKDPLTSEGDLATRGLSVDGQALSQQDTVIRWSGAQLSPDYRQVSVAQADVSSDFATLKATQVRWDAADAAAVSLSVEAAADLQKVFNLVARLSGSEKPPAIGGQLRLTSTAGAAGGGVALRGSGEIAQFTVGVGEKAVREERVQLEFDAAIDPKTERITLGRTKLASNPLSAEVTGSVEQYARGAVLNLKGRYDAQWEPITRLLHELAPNTAGVLAVKGASTSEFTVNGPASKPEVTPVYRGVAGATQVGWGAADVYGVALGQALLSPRLADGRVEIPPATVPASGGKLLVAGTVDLTAGEPTYVLPAPTRVIDSVSVNKLVSEMLLSYINPVFMKMARIDGQMFLDTQDVFVPLGDGLKTQGRGRGRLELRNCRMEPGGLLGELLSFAAVSGEQLYVVEISGFDFELRQGRIYYQDFWMRFGGGVFDLKFYGSVGLDGTIDLVVSVPISVQLLQRFGVRGPVAEYARLLAGTRIDIPISGTRESPKLEMARVDMDKVLGSVVKRGAEDLIGDALRGGLPGRKKDEPPPQPGEQPDKKKDRFPFPIPGRK
ncbi:MAG: hypothetical protein IPM13_10730 [Phycisphaerales bacterium]|nr:hypothetical protein [Phycisphaerales bacterium]